MPAWDSQIIRAGTFSLSLRRPLPIFNELNNECPDKVVVMPGDLRGNESMNLFRWPGDGLNANPNRRRD